MSPGTGYATTSLQLMSSTSDLSEPAAPIELPASTGTTGSTEATDSIASGGSTEVPIGATATPPDGSPAAPTSAGGKPAAGAQPSTDELVHRLFEPLAARLKAELRLDRERAGLVADLRY